MSERIRVLTDRHHHGLGESLHLLFADRFGWEVWNHYGMDWFDEGYWNFERQWHGDAVARQYLDGIWGDVIPGALGVRVKDVRHPDRWLSGVKLDAARDMHWDIVLSSLPHNDEGMHRFAQEVGAHFGVQVGNNVQQSRWDLAEFVLASSTLPDQGLVTPDTWARIVTAHDLPTVVYHQEFSLDIFRPEWPPADRDSIASFVNCFPETPPYGDFRRLAEHLPEFSWRCYGAYGSASVDDLAAGDISWVPDVADAMRATRIAFHAKAWSDGYGHVIHNWGAIGRPVIGIPRYYQDKLAGPLFVEGVTSYDLERYDLHQLVAILRRLRDDDDKHRRMSEAMAARFREVVSFDAEAEVIRTMLEGVLS